MARYDYKGIECGGVGEYEHPMADSFEGDDCLLCESGECTLKRVYTPTPAIFRGTGWAKMTEHNPKRHRKNG